MRDAVTLVVVLVAGCGPAPLPPPCPPAVEWAYPDLAPASSGGALEWGAEGLPEGTFVRRFDAAGALVWTVAPPPPAAFDNRRFHAAGDTVFAVDEKHISGYHVVAIRDGAVAFAADAPFDCRLYPYETEADGDGLRVYGTDSTHLCSYRIGADGTFGDLLAFDVASAYHVRRAPSGGYLVVNADGVIRYDASANRVWRHAGNFTAAVESAGAVFALRFDRPGLTLVSLGSDGQAELELASFGFAVGDGTLLAATGDGLVVAVANELVRATPTTALWQQTLDAAPAALALGGAVLLVRGRRLDAFDLDGNPLWHAARPDAATIGADDVARVADNKMLDPCRAVLRVSTLDGSGNVAVSWSAR